MQITSKARLGWLFCCIASLYGAILLTLFSIQVLHHASYKRMAHNQYHVIQTVPALRGAIIDRKGVPLAINQDIISAFILPNQLKDPEKVSQFMQNHFPASFERLQHQSTSGFMYIKRNLTPEQQELIRNAQLPDIKLLKEPGRYYPSSSLANIVGITDIDNKGQMGIELSCNTKLSGTPHVSMLQKDARSGFFYFEKATHTSGADGQTIQLTIDSDLQFIIARELEQWVKSFQAKQGAVVVIDPVQGDIISLVSYPTFDPNDTREIDLEATKNVPASDAYELGSVFKVFAALAALEEGVVTPDDMIDCKNVASAWVHGRRVNTVASTVRGIVPFWQVIAVSNNIGIATVAHMLKEKLYDHYLKLGFGSKIGLMIPNEPSGFVNHPYNWSAQSVISLSYGYEVNATLLQLARAFSVFANNGCLVKPYLLADNKPQEQSPQIYSTESIEAMRSILEMTTTYGTAKKARVTGYTVLSKTGTANLLVDGKYDPHKNCYTCAGVIERGAYKRVIVTFIKEAAAKNLYASTVAAPLFEKVAEKVVIHEKVL